MLSSDLVKTDFSVIHGQKLLNQLSISTVQGQEDVQIYFVRPPLN